MLQLWNGTNSKWKISGFRFIDTHLYSCNALGFPSIQASLKAIMALFVWSICWWISLRFLGGVTVGSLTSIGPLIKRVVVNSWQFSSFFFSHLIVQEVLLTKARVAPGCVQLYSTDILLGGLKKWRARQTPLLKTPKPKWRWCPNNWLTA